MTGYDSGGAVIISVFYYLEKSMKMYLLLIGPQL